MHQAQGNYHFARALWFGSPLSFRPDSLNVPSLSRWILHWLDIHDISLQDSKRFYTLVAACLLACSVWIIWKSKNDLFLSVSHSFALPTLPAAHPRSRESLPTAQVAPQWSLCLDVSINRNNNNNLVGAAAIVQARILIVHSILPSSFSNLTMFCLMDFSTGTRNGATFY